MDCSESLSQIKLADPLIPLISNQAGCGRRQIIGVLVEEIKNGLNLSIQLENQFEKVVNVKLRGQESNTEYLVRVSARRMGDDTGRDVLVHVGQQIVQIHGHMGEVLSGDVNSK